MDRDLLVFIVEHTQSTREVHFLSEKINSRRETFFVLFWVGPELAIHMKDLSYFKRVWKNPFTMIEFSVCSSFLSF